MNEKKVKSIDKSDVINICKTGVAIGIGAIILGTGYWHGYRVGQAKLWDAMTIWNIEEAKAFNKFIKAAVNSNK